MGKRTNTAKWMDKQGRWQINVQKDGERRSFYSSTPGRTGQRECNAKADAWLDDNIESTNLRISVLFDDYIESLKLTTSKSNWLKVDAFGRNWITPSIGMKKIAIINDQHLQDVINKAFTGGLSKKTLINLRGVLVSFMKYCRKRKVTILVPEDLTIPKGAKIAIKRILQPEDLVKLFSIDTTILYGVRKNDTYINAYRFQTITGLRPGELIGLRWEDISNGMVYIKRSVNAYQEETSGKNENAIRHFALTSKAIKVLAAQKLLYGKDCGSVFEIVSLSSYQKKWRTYCESNELTYISPYELRHTFISIAKNLPDGQIRPIVGHSKNMDPFGIYGHEVSGELQKTATELDHIFTEILTPEKAKK